MFPSRFAGAGCGCFHDPALSSPDHRRSASPVCPRHPVGSHRGCQQLNTRMPFPLLLHRFLTFGRRSELLGVDYIRSLGFRIVTSAYRTKDGEVDIIAWDDEVLVFSEVKARQ